VSETLIAYQHYRTALTRMATASPLGADRGLDLVAPFKLRRLSALAIPLP
jgi:hypothetical protein